MGEQDDVDRMLQSLTRAQEALRRAERDYERLRGQVDSADELPLVERIDAERSRVDEIIVALRGATATDRPPPAYVGMTTETEGGPIAGAVSVRRDAAARARVSPAVPGVVPPARDRESLRSGA